MRLTNVSPAYGAHPTRTAPARLRESAGFPPELSEWLERQDVATVADYARFRVLHREVVGNPEGIDAALRGMKPRDRKFWRENGERFLVPIAIEAGATA